MRVTVNVDCSPEEARTFLGLPDVTGLNALMVDRVASQAEANFDAMDPTELMKSWMSFGGMMREQFLTAMTGAAMGATSAADDENDKD